MTQAAFPAAQAAEQAAPSAEERAAPSAEERAADAEPGEANLTLEEWSEPVAQADEPAVVLPTAISRSADSDTGTCCTAGSIPSASPKEAAAPSHREESEHSMRNCQHDQSS